MAQEPSPAALRAKMQANMAGTAGRAAVASPAAVSLQFLTRPYTVWHNITSVFDHCNPDYTTDGRVCEFDGSVGVRSNGVDPSFSSGYAQTPGGRDYLYYDGHNGWKIEPWQGKRDPESLGEEEMHGILDDADFDGPLVNYQAKGNKVEYQGVEQIEGSDAYKLKVTRPNGDISFYYLDTEYYVPIRIDTQRMIRGAPQEFETSLGDYKQVNGVYLAFSSESGPKGSSSSDRSKITYDKIEANVPLDDQRFVRPGGARP